MEPTKQILQAEDTFQNLEVILGLIEEARGWLPTKETDQWTKPWPDEEARNNRIRKGLESGATWIVWDGNTPAGTITLARRPNIAVWPKWACDLSEPAVYAHRLIVARKYAGDGLGAELLGWAGLRGQRQYGAKWIRIDVWTTNLLLHKYYNRLGFVRCGTCPEDEYPSGALFQKDISKIRPPDNPQFEEQLPALALPESITPELDGIEDHAEHCAASAMAGKP